MNIGVTDANTSILHQFKVLNCLCQINTLTKSAIFFVISFKSSNGISTPPELTPVASVCLIRNNFDPKSGEIIIVVPSDNPKESPMLFTYRDFVQSEGTRVAVIVLILWGGLRACLANHNTLSDVFALFLIFIKEGVG